MRRTLDTLIGFCLLGVAIGYLYEYRRSHEVTLRDLELKSRELEIARRQQDFKERHPCETATTVDAKGPFLRRVVTCPSPAEE